MQTESTMIASLYIPIVNSETTDEYIGKCFNEKNIGKVSRVDFVFNKEKQRREAFVHFSEWFNTDQANRLKTELETNIANGKKCRFIYNKNMYWPILINKNPLDKSSPERKSNGVYEIEERINTIEKNIERLSFMTNLHDANIRYIVRRSNSESNKRLKTEESICNNVSFG
jgi:hypothetical protein